MWQQIIPILTENQSFILTAHINPDGDALGSELALAEHLRRLGKKVTIINSDPTPQTYRFLDSKRRIKRFSPKRHTNLINNIEVIIVLDASGGWSRLGPVGQVLAQSSAYKICIDHHPDACDFVDIAIIDTEAAATGELIFELIQAMGGKLTQLMGRALYAAILTDTGSFRFPKTSARTHYIAAKLIEAGVNPLKIYSHIYEQNALGAIQLKGQVMASIQTAAGGQVTFYGLSQTQLKACGVKSSELDGLASLGQQIAGVRVSLFCMETTNGKVKISLRSDGSVAINQIAQEYGGGGHPSAAGALVEGTVDAVLAELVEKLTELLL